ncbi:hypothetical protein N0V90_010482 [Kalmusia sp. IMI 367209]|nr:hypothetical protein N0V90_010482 [Kalmusia sp. IMI 367209]
MAKTTLPPANGMSSFWRSSPGALDDYRSTESLPAECDVLIVGAGYSGASLITHFLSQAESANKSFVILEARQLCSGASGRNGGHCKPDPYNVASSAARIFGVKAGAEIAEFEIANLNAIKEYVRETGVDCDFNVTQAVDVQLSVEHNEALKARYDEFIANGGEVAKTAFYTPRKDAEMISGIKGAKGVYKYTTAHLWPYKLIHHMFTHALTFSNVNLQTHTPALSIPSSQSPDGTWPVTTPRGTIRARTIIIATNAYTAALLPEYQDKIIPYRTICSRIVTPGPSMPPLLNNSYALRFNELDFDYLIPRTDGSIIVGGARRTYLRDLDEWYGNVDDSKIIEKGKNYFDGYMQRYFRGWEDSGAYTEQVWAGIMGYSSDQFPRIGPVPGRQNMFIMGGFTGHGMPQIFLAAKGLSEMVLKDVPFENTGIPSLFKESRARLESKENFALDMHRRVKESKL